VKKKKDSEIVSDLLKSVEASYFLYKICEGCDCLVMYETNVCSNCNTYRFNTKKSSIIKHVKLLIKKEKKILLDSLKD